MTKRGKKNDTWMTNGQPPDGEIVEVVVYDDCDIDIFPRRIGPFLGLVAFRAWRDYETFCVIPKPKRWRQVAGI